MEGVLGWIMKWMEGVGATLVRCIYSPYTYGLTQRRVAGTGALG
jgi:hypothetical protein